MWPFTRTKRANARPRPETEAELLAFAAEKFSHAPVAVWGWPSDAGEAIFRDAALCFLPDGSGWLQVYNSGFKPEVETFHFEYQLPAPGRLRIRSTEADASWFEASFAYRVREGVHGLRTLVLDIKVNDSGERLARWLGDGYDYCSHCEPKPLI